MQFNLEKRNSTITREVLTSIEMLLKVMKVPFLYSEESGEKLCCYLSRIGLVDAVNSSDGDCILYGATEIYKNLFGRGHDSVEIYTARSIEEKCKLSRHDLVFLSLFLNSADGKYKGTKGIGIKTAMEIIQVLT